MYLFIGTVYVNEYLKDIHLNCRERYEDMFDHRCYTHNSFRPEFVSGFNSQIDKCLSCVYNYVDQLLLHRNASCRFKMNAILNFKQTFCQRVRIEERLKETAVCWPFTN